MTKTIDTLKKRNMNNKIAEQRVVQDSTPVSTKNKLTKKNLLSVLENTETVIVPIDQVIRHNTTLEWTQSYCYTYMINGQDIGSVIFQKWKIKNILQLTKLSNINFQINLQSWVNPIDLYDFRSDLSIYEQSLSELKKIYGQPVKIPWLWEHMLRDVIPVIQKIGYKYIRIRSVQSAAEFYRRTMEKLKQEWIIQKYKEIEKNIWLIDLRK